MTRALLCMAVAVGCATPTGSRDADSGASADTGTVARDTGTAEAAGVPGTDDACDPNAVLPRRLRRLSHRELAHSLTDLFAVAVDPNALAADPTVEGFDNDAASLRVSALLADQYRSLAEAVSTDADLSAWALCDPAIEGLPCAQDILPDLARSVWRRPFTDSERAAWSERLVLLTADEDADTGLRWALAALLQSPHFLYRSELGDPSDTTTVVLTPWEQASALSFDLLGTTPDRWLLDGVSEGVLDSPAGLDETIARLLDDPRHPEHIADLAEAWLHLGPLQTVGRVNLDDVTRASLHEGFRARITDAAVRGDAVSALLDTGGLLTDPALLTVHGVAAGSGPVQRGVMVRELLLCEPLPPPPSGVDTSAPDVDPDRSTRERFTQHADDPVCAGCHDHIDPLGFTFEHYDQLGRWRDTDDGHPIDATGHLDGVAVDGATELAGALARDPRVATCFVRTARRWVSGSTACADATSDVELTEPLVAWSTRSSFAVRATE